MIRDPEVAALAAELRRLTGQASHLVGQIHETLEELTVHTRTYVGPERRVNPGPYTGVDRRRGNQH